MINIRNLREISLLKRANELAFGALDVVESAAESSISLNELDSIANDFILKNNAKPSFKGLYGFPKAICLSVNEVIIHGIPNDYKLKNGDILGIDIGVQKDGYFGDCARTIGIGAIKPSDEALIACAKDALYYAIDNLRVGLRFKELSAILEEFIVNKGYFPLKGFCGHGIGSKPHEEPEIPNFIVGSTKDGPKIKNGMVFCIEPMICQKNGDYKILNDKWSVTSKDGLNGAHYEHAIAMIDNRAVILSTN